jgi:hypothetical protein
MAPRGEGGSGNSAKAIGEGLSSTHSSCWTDWNQGAQLGWCRFDSEGSCDLLCHPKDHIL